MVRVVVVVVVVVAGARRAVVWCLGPRRRVLREGRVVERVVRVVWGVVVVWAVRRERGIVGGGVLIGELWVEVG